MSVPDPRTFYAVSLPEQFNRALEAQAAKGDDAEPLLSKLQATNASITAIVEGEGGGEFHLDIVDGRMTRGFAISIFWRPLCPALVKVSSGNICPTRYAPAAYRI